MTHSPFNLTRTTAGLVALTLAWTATAAEQSAAIPRDYHMWGRFEPGDWALVRKLTEDYDEQGQLKAVSTTETKTTLVEADDSGFSLRLEVTMEVGGKRFNAQPRVMRLGYYGETNGQRVTVKKTGTESFELGGTKVACDVLEVAVEGADEKSLTTLCYSPALSPFVLRRDSRATNLDGKQLHRQIQIEVVAVEMPQKVLAETLTAAHVRTIEKYPQGSTFTVEVVCADVPGGVVAHSSREQDDSGRLVRRSTLELVDHGVAVTEKSTGRPGIFRHRTVRRTSVFREP